MSKSNQKKLTLEDIIAKKLNRDKMKTSTLSIYVEAMGGELEFMYPTDEDVLSLLNSLNGDKAGDVALAYVPMIYNNCKLLQSQDLTTQFEVTDPYDTVLKVFSVNEILFIGGELATKINTTKVQDEIKN